MTPEDQKAMDEAFAKAMAGIKAFNEEADSLSKTIKGITGK